MSKELIKAGLETSNNILLEVYGDLLKPGVSQVGKAIGTIIGLGNTLLMPIALKNEKTKLIMQDNLNKYRQKLEDIPEENIQSVVPEVGVPILEKLMYVSDDTLVDLYTELLANASSIEKGNSTHPSFVNIINNLSPKEAQILKLIKENVRAVVEVSIKVDSTTKPTEQISEFILEKELYDNNFKAYLSNLIGLGLIDVSYNKSLSNKNRYVLLENEIKHVYSRLPVEHAKTPELSNLREGNLQFHRGIIRTTEFGELFLVACTNSSKHINFYDLFEKL